MWSLRHASLLTDQWAAGGSTAQVPSSRSPKIDLGDGFSAYGFCEAQFRKKTDVVREALTSYFEKWAIEQKGKAKNKDQSN